MIPEKVKEILKKQHYKIVGKHSAVQICRWTKKSIRDEGFCYKEQFYGINSHKCCQMTPAVMWCPNKCLHCWRAVEHTIDCELKGKLDSPKEIIDGCIEGQKKLLEGFKIDPKTEYKTKSRANMKKWAEAQEPDQFAISLSGEPLLYKNMAGIVKELRKRKKTSFIVTNGLYPEKILELEKEKALPTQLYVSVNTSNEKDYNKFHRSQIKDAWKKLMKTLKIFSKIKGKTRTVFRINLVKELNMDDSLIPEYAELIKIANPDFVEIKGFMSVGYSRERLGYERMPTFSEMEEFVKKLANETGLRYLDSHERSRAFVLGKNKKDLKIKKGQI